MRLNSKNLPIYLSKAKISYPTTKVTMHDVEYLIEDEFTQTDSLMVHAPYKLIR